MPEEAFRRTSDRAPTFIAPWRMPKVLHLPVVDEKKSVITLRGTNMEAQAERFKDLIGERGYTCSQAIHDVIDRRATGTFGRAEILDATSEEKRAGVDIHLLRYGPGAHDFMLQRLVIFTRDPTLIELAQETGGTISL